MTNPSPHCAGSANGVPVADYRKAGITISKKIFVGNLSFQTSEQELREAFSAAGSLVDVHIGKDRETGRSRGFAFVEFSSEDEAGAAIRMFNETELGGRKLHVNPAEDRPPGRAPRNDWNSGRAPRSEGFAPGGSQPGGFGPSRKSKGSRRGIRGRKRSLG